jgi:uncharacterized oxidoreductase
MTAKSMTEIVIDKAKKNGIAVALSTSTRHIGRCGSYATTIADAGLIAFLTVGVYGTGPMAPWGAKESRLSTNPICWAVPRLNGKPVFMDGATTVVAEGKIRASILEGKDIPIGWVKDGYGRDTTNPHDLYGTPRGTIYPLGGKTGGAKGSGLAIMADMFSIALTNDEYWSEFEAGRRPRRDNSVFMMAANPDMFCGLEEYKKQVEGHCQYIKSAKPDDGFKEVLLPGEFEYKKLEQSLTEGCYVADDTWGNLCALGRQYGCEFSKEMDDIGEVKNAVVQF